MRMITKRIVDHSCEHLNWFSRILGSARAMAGLLCVASLWSPGQAVGQTVPGAYDVTLAWSDSSSADVTGYIVSYGTASGSYTNGIVVENATSVTISGLESGATYFFAASAYGSSGLVSEYSNEISFQPGLHSSSIITLVSGEIVLKMTGLIGQSYDIEASPDLVIWENIATVTMGDAGSVEFNDPNAADFPRRFYRTRESQ